MGKVLVDSSAMEMWRTKMQSVNSNCVDDIEKIENVIRSLNDSFQGDYESAFAESFTNYCNIIKESHNNMKDFSGFLDKIYEIMNNQ
ncbi:MAG TPA: hypothetical protein DCE23_08780 [Firmicutes bacterium]|nr:hypothetical protein [Bacillota bacterium]